MHKNFELTLTLLCTLSILSIYYIFYLKHCYKCCTENTAKGACWEINTAQGKAECFFISRYAPKSCIFCTHEFRWCFKWYIVVWVNIELCVSDYSGSALNWKWSGQVRQWILRMMHNANKGNWKLVSPSLIKTAGDVNWHNSTECYWAIMYIDWIPCMYFNHIHNQWQSAKETYQYAKM